VVHQAELPLEHRLDLRDERRIGEQAGDLVLVFVGHQLEEGAGDCLGQRRGAERRLGGAHPKPAAQVAFARRWGDPVQQNPLLKGIDGFPELIQVTKIPKETASTEAWHYDSPYTPVPPKISILAAVRVPRGGDTMWCNQYESYERLSPVMKKMLEGLRVRFTGLRLARMMGSDEAKIPSAVHPLVRTHPETGRRALYIGHRETAQQIEGMTREESRPILDFLYEHSTNPDNLYRHMWQEGDVVMWTDGTRPGDVRTRGVSARTNPRRQAARARGDDPFADASAVAGA
jgi:taurine dioxygenase